MAFRHPLRRLRAATAGEGKLDQASFERIDAIRFPLVVGVVFIHAYASSERAAPNVRPDVAVDFFRDFVSNGLAAPAVPLFFFLAAFLFFRGGTWSTAIYVRKLRARVRTLLVPYVAWNVLVMAAIALAQWYPGTARYFHQGYAPVFEMAPWDVVNTTLGITHAPIAYQFWFIKDLMVLVVLGPLVYLAVTKAGAVLLAVLGLAWILDVAPHHVLDLEAVCFFCAGAYVAVRRLPPFALDPLGPLLGIAWLLLVASDAWSGRAMENTPLHNVAVLVGCAALLCASRALLYRAKPVLLKLAGASFFVFAAHEPLLTAVGKFLSSVRAPDTPLEMLMLYVLVPCLVLAACGVFYVVVRRLPLPLQAVLTGGRDESRAAGAAPKIAPRNPPLDPV